MHPKLKSLLAVALLLLQLSVSALGRLVSLGPCSALSGEWFGGTLDRNGMLSDSVAKMIVNEPNKVKLATSFNGELTSCSAPSPGLEPEPDDTNDDTRSTIESMIDPSLLGQFDILVTESAVVPFRVPCSWRFVDEEHEAIRLACAFHPDPSLLVRPVRFATLPPDALAWVFVRIEQDDAADVASSRDAARGVGGHTAKSASGDNSAEARKEELSRAWLSDEVLLTVSSRGRTTRIASRSGPALSGSTKVDEPVARDALPLTSPCVVIVAPFFNGAGRNNTFSLWRNTSVGATGTIEEATVDPDGATAFAAIPERRTPSSLSTTELNICAAVAEQPGDPLSAVYALLARSARHLPPHYHPDENGAGGQLWIMPEGIKIQSLQQLSSVVPGTPVMIVPRHSPYMWPGIRLGFSQPLLDLPPQGTGKPVELTTLSLRPRVFLLSGLLSEAECLMIRELANRSEMTYSNIDTSIGKVYDYSRTSSTVWLQSSSKTAAIYDRVFRALRLNNFKDGGWESEREEEKDRHAIKEKYDAWETAREARNERLRAAWEERYIAADSSCVAGDGECERRVRNGARKEFKAALRHEETEENEEKKRRGMRPNSLLSTGGGIVHRTTISTEPLQVLRYKHGQHYWVHQDASKTPFSRSSTRMATLLVYLNDVPKGGGTNFPQAPFGWFNKSKSFYLTKDGKDEVHLCNTGVSAKPKMGDAVLFYDLTVDDLLPDDHSYHQGCDVLVESEKWASNVWVHMPVAWRPEFKWVPVSDNATTAEA